MAKNATTYERGVVYEKTLHDTVTADATSNAVNVAGAKAVTFEFTEGGTVNNRQADFTVDISVDGGTTFMDYNMLVDNVTNSNSQNYTRIATKNRASTGSDLMWMDPNTLGAITHIKVELDVTDGASPTGNFTVQTAIMY